MVPLSLRSDLIAIRVLFGRFCAASACAERFCFAPSGESLLSNDTKGTKRSCPIIRVSLRETPLAPSKFQGHASTGHPWPNDALAASMPLNP